MLYRYLQNRMQAAATQHRSVPVYLPRTKQTILVPKPISKLVFEMNYKGLATTRHDISGDEVMIELQKFEDWRRCLQKWQISATGADKSLWEFLKLNVAIEISLIDVDPAADLQTKTQPYVPILRFNIGKIEEFETLFYAAKFGK